MAVTKRLPLPEFIALVALLFGMTAFSMDSFLPALPAMAEDLTPEAPTLVQYVLTAFVFGLGVGTFMAGPLADAFGRRRIILIGLTLYAIGSLLAALSPNLGLMVASRLLQGIAVALPRIAALAMVRDLYQGRQMARITSFVMTVFLMLPAAAPLVGAFIIAGFGWHGIFGTFMLLAVVAGLWVFLRQRETLPVESRRKLQISVMIAGLREVLGNRAVVRVVIMLTLSFGQLLATITSVQSIYDVTFGRGLIFPYLFALTALLSTAGALMNAKFVVRLGMRRLALLAYTALAGITLLTLLIFTFSSGNFWIFFVWTVVLFLCHALTFGNLNAMALQPLGHLAGLASSLIAGISTVGGTLLAIPIGQAFNGTPIPLFVGVLICSGLGAILIRGAVDTAD